MSHEELSKNLDTVIEFFQEYGHMLDRMEAYAADHLTPRQR